VQSRLKDTGRRPLKIALGLAMPCIEAWFGCGRDPTVTEANWFVALREWRFPYDNRRLKTTVYGSDRVSLANETRRMIEEANRLSSNLANLETWFRNGFGPFAADVRGWLAAS
jgi:hypothetical protein